MKAYIFKLQAVLKLRKIKEEKCRVELGQLIVALNKINNQIVYDGEEISKYFEHQEFNLKNSNHASKIQIFSLLVESKQRNLKILNEEKKRQEKLIEIKKLELAKLRADLKVIEKLREKDFEQYKKDFNKKLNDKIEEQTQIWMNSESEEDIA